MVEFTEECGGPDMPELQEKQSCDGTTAEIYIDMADDDSSDGDYELDPEGSEDCSTESDEFDSDVEVVGEEAHQDPTPAQVSGGVGYDRKVRPRRGIR